MAEIIPAILEKNWEEAEKKIKAVGEFASWAQIDIADGKFVPRRSWNNSGELSKAKSQLPKIDIEIDMMVNEPEDSVLDWLNAGAKRLVIHIESTQNLQSIIRLCKEKGAEIGVALNIETPNEVLDEWIGQIDFVQFMGIIKIGFQGQPFDSRVLDKISDLRAKYPTIAISVDGGVDSGSVGLLKKAGASRLVAGSYIWQNPNPKAAFERLSAQ